MRMIFLLLYAGREGITKHKNPFGQIGMMLFWLKAPEEESTMKRNASCVLDKENIKNKKLLGINIIDFRVSLQPTPLGQKQLNEKKNMVHRRHPPIFILMCMGSRMQLFDNKELTSPRKNWYFYAYTFLFRKVQKFLENTKPGLRRLLII